MADMLDDLVESLAASGAYWVASAASEFYVIPDGEVGSIGVVTAHQDVSKALGKAGVQTTLTAAGKYNTEGNPFEPLGTDARQHVQSRVDDYYRMFVGAVAKHRGVPEAAVRNGMGQGRLLDAQRAKREARSAKAWWTTSRRSTRWPVGSRSAKTGRQPSQCACRLRRSLRHALLRYSA